jgi:hypothetical protein
MDDLCGHSVAGCCRQHLRIGTDPQVQSDDMQALHNCHWMHDLLTDCSRSVNTHSVSDDHYTLYLQPRLPRFSLLDFHRHN